MAFWQRPATPTPAATRTASPAAVAPPPGLSSLPTPNRFTKKTWGVQYQVGSPSSGHMPWVGFKGTPVTPHENMPAHNPGGTFG